MTATLMNPTDLRGVRDAVLDSAGALAVVGAGTAAGWAGALGPVDAVLDLSALSGVIAHNPGDMTVSVRAGTPLRTLNAELAEHGQHVAFDAARVADGATVGGLLATADAGPAALVFGSLRDLVIGATLVLADGTVARSGGHVIKNVAGYDLTKLVHGSYGTLAVVAEVVLRLHPVPRAVATLALPCTLDEAAGHAAAILGGPYEPAALEWVSASAPSNPDHIRAPAGGSPGSSELGALLVRVEGTEAALPERVERLRAVLGPAAVPIGVAGVAPAGSGTASPEEGHGGPHGGTAGPEAGGDPGSGAPDLGMAAGASGAAADAGPDARLDVDAAARLAFSREEGDGHRDSPGGSAVRPEAAVTAEAPAGGDAADPWAGHTRLTRGTLDDAVLRIGVRPSRLPGVLAGLPARSITAGLGTGAATVALQADPAVVAAAHAAVHAAGGTSVLRSRPPGLDAPAWGPPPSAVGVLRAVKQELDPAGRLGPGRLAPWL